MKKPNFFIIGAPKCGTTALTSYLSCHENIFLTDPKEPHYFSSDMKPYSCCNSLDEYLSLFDNVTDKHKLIGEASVMYLYSEDAIKNLYEFDPTVKLIVALRNPVDYLYSYHSQMLINHDEDVENFKTAWELCEERSELKHIPKTCRINKLLDYKSVGKLGEQVENVLKIFPKEQVFFFLLEDMKNDSLQLYKDILDFLELEYDGKVDFPVVNENKKYRFKYLNKFKNNPPKNLLNTVRFIKKKIGLGNVSLMGKVYERNLKSAKREAIEEELKNEISQYFKDDIEKLSKLINRDLEHWKI